MNSGHPGSFFQAPVGSARHPFILLAQVAPRDRFGVSLAGSTLLHVVLILGLGFVLPHLRALDGLPTLEITLVQTSSDTAPKDPEFLAQANQDGGGNSERPDIARNPFPVREITDRHTDTLSVLSIPQAPVSGSREKTELMTDQDPRKVRPDQTRQQKKEARVEPLNPGLIERSAVEQERARLNAEIARSMQELQKRPRRKFLNARTQEYKYAAYLDAWRAKVERIGNLNYPDEARRRQLTGSLVLDVAINPDGTVNGVSVRRSSGHKLLDDAAVRIVELAAPFSPLPPQLRAETDVLHITRTWKFNETLTSD
jgi:protein TonB